VLLSWVDGKIAPEAATKNLEATLEMLKRETATAKPGSKLGVGVEKARTLLTTALAAVKRDDKAAAIDAAANLTDVRNAVEDAGN
jgi:hypothetical protein